MTIKYFLKCKLRNILFKFMDDETYIKFQFKAKTGKKLNLDNPQTFSEKVQWLKLYDRNPIYTTFVDKAQCKEYLKTVVPSKYIIKTYGVFDKFDDINFDELPDKFVIKCTHDSGSIIVCDNKKIFMDNIKEHRKKIMAAQKYDFYRSGREYHYKNVPKKIIVEEFLENKDKTKFLEYKLWCFYGDVKLVDVVEKNDNSPYGVVSNYYDLEWNALDLKFLFPKRDTEFDKPQQLKELVNIAHKLSKDYPVMRVDMYIVNDQIKIGELTIYHSSGYSKMHPEHWDYDIGQYITLDKIKERNAMNNAKLK